MNITNGWSVYWMKDDEYRALPHPVTCEADLCGCPVFRDVTVPTVFEKILYSHHVLNDPYTGTNTWDYQAYEDVHQFWVCRVERRPYKTQRIIFEGIDTIAEVYANGRLIGTSDNMFIPLDLVLPDLTGTRTTEILVHILPNCVEGLKYDLSVIKRCMKYNKESVYLRKTQSSTGWDILPRTPLGGIYRPVLLSDEWDPFDDVRITTDLSEGDKARVHFHITLKASFRGTVEILYGCPRLDNSEKFPVRDGRCEGDIVIPSPKLWNIRGYGKQHLYRYGLVFTDTHGFKKAYRKGSFGIRTVELRRSSIVEEGGSFEFIVNGKKVFLMGSNWVPTDALMHMDEERAERALNMLLDLGCNAVRIWGGGTYEDDRFYDLCDKYGIFVWQDFMMACSDYPQDDDFCERLGKEVTYTVRRLRDHPSICLWSGDNEVDQFIRTAEKGPQDNILTRSLIPSILVKEDRSRPYLPSSPYYDEVAMQHPNRLSEDHLWGPRDYFKGPFYSSHEPYFVSETGYHALNSPASLKKFIEKPWPLFVSGAEGDPLPTPEYLAHATSCKNDYASPYRYRIKLMYDQVKTLFTSVPNDLRTFAKASQISQAEALKYFIEKVRKDRQRNGGIIWWNILDGWPQVSDAVVDYYFDKKIAYTYIKQSQQPQLALMDETKDTETVFCVNETDADDVFCVKIRDLYGTGKPYEATVSCPARSSVTVLSFPNDGQHHFYLLDCTSSSGGKAWNHFHTNILKIDLERYCAAARTIGLIRDTDVPD
ncbi:MAG: hypothetical protein IJR83_03075 [Clostridia bacterium]|nr:hypothetical protein [Clostridia bacterium]